MTQPVSSKPIKALDWLMSALMVSFNVLFAGAFLVSGLLITKFGLIVCGIGWILVTVPVYYRQRPAKQLARWSIAAGVAGGLIFLLGLAIHGGAL